MELLYPKEPPDENYDVILRSSLNPFPTPIHSTHAILGRMRTPHVLITGGSGDLGRVLAPRLLDACEKANVTKCVFISSSSVEEWPDIYGTTQLLGDELCRSYAARSSSPNIANSS